MKVRSILFGMVALAGSSGMVLAGTLAGGPVYSPFATYARCMVFNAGNTNATIQQHFISNGAAAIALDFDNCGITLGARRGCVIGGPAKAVTHMCRITYTGGDLRGNVAVYNSNGSQVSESPMR